MRLGLMTTLFVAAAVAVPHGGARKVSFLQSASSSMMRLTIDTGNATACHNTHALIHVYAYEERYGARCNPVNVYVDANEAIDSHLPDESGEDDDAVG